MKNDNTQFGLNIIGHISGNLGLGVLSRNIIKQIIKRDIPICLFDLDPGENRKNHDNRFSNFYKTSPSELIHPINIFILTPVNLSEPFVKVFNYNKKINVAFSMWELPKLPTQHVDNLNRMDIVIAGSRFIFESFSQALDNPLLFYTPTPIETLSANQKITAKQKTDDETLIFYTGFEPASDPTRKNPNAVISAFRNAFTDDENCELLVEANNIEEYVAKNGIENIEFLTTAALEDPRIKIISRTLDSNSLVQLYRYVDVNVSLHRAEGFGFVPIEMMIQGTPSIATNWSGTADYLNPSNAFLVRHKMIPANGTIDFYKSEYYTGGTVWADPSIEDAKNWMKLIYTNREVLNSHSKNCILDAQAYIEDTNKAVYIDHLKNYFESNYWKILMR